MRHRGRGVKVVGCFIFLTPETHWLSVDRFNPPPRQHFDFIFVLLQLSKIMLSNTVKLHLAIVMYIILVHKKTTLLRSSKSCDCVTFRVFKYLFSTFPLYTPHCQLILSKQKCCLLLTGVSTESQKHTSVLQTKRAF